jgi:AraC-like DNA-binding protein
MALLARLQEPSFAEQVQLKTAAHVRAGSASMTDVARALDLSVATLRRHLQREGKRFSDILCEARRDLAVDLLSNTSMSIADVARSVGFSHTAVFYRAFRRWFHDVTPTDLRGRARRHESLRSFCVDATGQWRGQQKI